jgi:hypothetical protein
MLNRIWKTALAVVTTVVTGSAAKADFVIDTFTNPNPAQTYTLGNTNGSTYSSGPSVLPSGVSRTVTVRQVGAVTIAAQGFFGTSAIDGAAFQLNTSNSNSGSATYAQLHYGYGAAQNLQVGGPVLRFSFDALQTPTPFSVVLSDGVTSSTQTGLVAVSGTTTNFSIPLSNFSGTNLSAITSIDLFVNRNVSTNSSAPDADVTLRDVRVSQDVPPPPASVPAPPVAVLLLAAAPALGLVRFGRRKLAA